MDGIDAAIVDTDGEGFLGFGPTRFEPYPSSTRDLVRVALGQAATLRPGNALSANFDDLEKHLTSGHAVAVLKLLTASGLKNSDIDIVGFHGQTLLHRPAERFTIQIGSGPLLAQALAIDVVSDFRTADLRAGGQGAPLVPIYHAALAGKRVPVAVLNIGGVANVTLVGQDGVLAAFDTGPGNGPLDDWALKHTGKPVDEFGALAAKGRVNEGVIAELLSHAYFKRPAPKALDRMEFTLDMTRTLSAEDGAATLTAFTARSIAAARDHFVQEPLHWIVCGGGRHNPMLMRELRTALSGATVITAEDAGWRGDFIEAESFAYLAVRSLRGLPFSFPTTTGVPRAMSGGVLSSLGR